jgi:chemotaxis protein MotA
MKSRFFLPMSAQGTVRPDLPCCEKFFKETLMFAIIGIVVVIGAILGGYLMEHGSVRVLIQPAELIIIGGAAAGTVLIANPLHILKQIAGGITVVFKGSKFTQQRYIDSLRLIYELLNKARRQGLMSLEADIEDPDKSPIFSKDPAFMKDHHVRDFFCDSMRMAISGVEAFELDQLMEMDLEVHHHEASVPVASLSTMADSLPGLGIVAAVLGVVITMQALGGPPEEIGHKVAAALVGTFLGILMCYGFVGPLSANMSKAADEEKAYLYVLKVVLISFLKGTAPIMAVEAARRAIPGHVRPSFSELEQACRGGGPGTSTEAAPEAQAAASSG